MKSIGIMLVAIITAEDTNKYNVNIFSMLTFAVI